MCILNNAFQTVKPRSILSDKGTTASGSQEILNYFSKEVFSNPKPTTLIEYFIEVFTDDKAIILDFCRLSNNC